MINADGQVIERKNFNEDEGIILTEIALNSTERKIADIKQNRYWIPDLPDEYLKAWQELNPIASAYYREYMLPYYHKHDHYR